MYVYIYIHIYPYIYLIHIYTYLILVHWCNLPDDLGPDLGKYIISYINTYIYMSNPSALAQPARRPRTGPGKIYNIINIHIYI